MELKDICQYVSDRVATTSLSTSNYISTENMLPNKGGVVIANGLPLGNAVAFAKNDVLVSNIRPYFKKIWQANKNGGCSADVLCFRKNENVDNKYFYYLLSQQSFFDHMMLGSKGCKMPRGDKKQIMNWSFDLPSLEEQKRIADILSSLDSKIELNRRINDNLEQQAQALFKSWFVDFEPFKDGKFVESEMGMIPEEWKVASLKELVFNTNSGDWGKEEPTGNYTVRVYCMRGADFPEVKEGNIGKMPIRYILQKNFDNKALKHGNMIVEISGGSPTQSTGRAVLIDKIFIDYCENALVCTNFCRSLTIREKYALFFFLTWQCLYDKKVMFIYENGSNGLKNLNLNDLLEKETIVIPPLEIIERFNLLTAKLFELKYFNGSETARLNQIRDTLLPRLMSGELKINDLNC